MRNFFINLCVITGIVGAAGSFFAETYLPHGLAETTFLLPTYLCIYFFALTAISHYIIIRPGKTNEPNQNFINRFLVVTVSKLIFSTLILLGYVFLNAEKAVFFIFFFASCYLLFGAFEAISLYLFFRRKK